ncbi:protein of unknown function [Pedobacter westerhofensis]|uniref:DUF4625 domain-containing protein n=1 Tax=Pedobacter westerhofensis TaxID=425512 RepID=A0A521FBN8_9SPHI|nr:DUF4625 domain-containing protein [Pedobacter westerhofensis]SMO93575.1 protein of unknown function [Pedobacter westerhofensis]
MMKSQHSKFMKMRSTMFVCFFIAIGITACKKDAGDEPERVQPTIQNLEIGINNNEIGVIGKDFHLNADVLVSGKIENVQVKILPRTGETYVKAWSHEITWDTYKDAKNTTVHKHFYIPTDAAEGKYDFVVVVNDQNGSKLEVKKSITIYAEANVPVNTIISH